MDQLVEIDCLDRSSPTHRAVGDATCIRYGVAGDFTVMVFDCGNRESASALIRHIREHYISNTVNHLVCSALGLDNLLGLALILEQMEVQELWLHRPWLYSTLVAGHVTSGGFDAGLGAGQKNTMRAAYALEKSALARGIPVIDPFQGAAIGAFTVLSPQRRWYAETLANDRHGVRRLVRAMRFCLDSLAACLGRASADTRLIGGDAQRAGASAANVALFGRIGAHTILLTSDAGQRVMSCSSVSIGAIPRRAGTSRP